MISAFEAFAFWVVLCWLVYQCKVEPLQPDQLEDDLTDVDLSERSRQLELREAAWLDRPVVNLRLSRRWLR